MSSRCINSWSLAWGAIGEACGTFRKLSLVGGSGSGGVGGSLRFYSLLLLPVCLLLPICGCGVTSEPLVPTTMMEWVLSWLEENLSFPKFPLAWYLIITMHRVTHTFSWASILTTGEFEEQVGLGCIN